LLHNWTLSYNMQHPCIMIRHGQCIIEQWCQKWMQSCPIWMWIWPLFWMMFEPCSWKWSKNNSGTTHQYLIWGQQYTWETKCSSCHEGTLNPMMPLEHGSDAMGSLGPTFSNCFNSWCNWEGYMDKMQENDLASTFEDQQFQCKCMVLNVDFCTWQWWCTIGANGVAPHWDEKSELQRPCSCG